MAPFMVSFQMTAQAQSQRRSRWTWINRAEIKIGGAGENEHGSWHFLGRDHADHRTALGQAVLCDAACDPRQCWGVPLWWRLSGTDGWHGQLRALNKLTANGQSLLAQAKALSTVSGGSWLGVPFIYLPPGSPNDDAYLGPWIEDQSTLTPAVLAQLPAGNAGVPISSPLFAPKLLAVQALLLHAVLRVPSDMLWQTIIGLNILADYGLYAPTIHLTPTDTFPSTRRWQQARLPTQT